MEIKKDLFASIINYTPTSEDITLLELINRILYYKKEKSLKNKEFLEKTFSGFDNNTLDHIIKHLSISCSEYPEEYTLVIDSNVSSIHVNLIFSLKKDTMSPSISLKKAPANELEKILADIFLSDVNLKDFIDICIFNTLFNNYKTYTIETNAIPLKLKIDDRQVTLNYDDLSDNIFSLYLGSNSVSLYEEIFRFNSYEELVIIINNLSFFLENSYVKKENIPPILLSYNYSNQDEFAGILAANPAYSNKKDTKEETYYIEINSEFKELTNVRAVHPTDKEYYVITFNDESTLMVANTLLFKIEKNRRSVSMAEKALGLK